MPWSGMTVWQIDYIGNIADIVHNSSDNKEQKIKKRNGVELVE